MIGQNARANTQLCQIILRIPQRAVSRVNPGGKPGTMENAMSDVIGHSCISPAGKGVIDATSTEYDGTLLVRVNDAWFALDLVELV